MVTLSDISITENPKLWMLSDRQGRQGFQNIPFHGLEVRIMYFRIKNCDSAVSLRGAFIA